MNPLPIPMSPPNDPFSQLSQRAVQPSDRVLDALRAEMRETPSKRRSLTRGQRALFSALALGLGLLLTSLRALGQHPQTLLLAAAAYSLAVGALLFAGVIPGNMSRWSRGPRHVLLTVLAMGLMMGLAIEAEHFLPLGDFLTPMELRHASSCFAYALISGVMCSTALMLLWRRSDPFSPGLTGSFLGLLGGIIGTMSVEMSCASAEGFHLTLAHGLEALLLAAAGYFAGRRWLTP